MRLSGNDEPKMRAQIITPGHGWRHPRDSAGRCCTLVDWWMDGGDFVGWDVGTGRLGGWLPEELVLLSMFRRYVPEEVVLEVAEEARLTYDIVLFPDIDGQQEGRSENDG